MRIGNERFQTLMKCNGWGDPQKDGIWFIGLEEADEWSETNIELLNRYINPFMEVEKGEIEGNRKRAGNKFTKVVDIMSAVILNSGFDATYNGKRDDYVAYSNSRLFLNQSRIFQANLFPLGKKKFKGMLPDAYTQLFELHKDMSLDDYQNIVRKDRFPILHRFWEETQPSTTICFGYQGWKDFKVLLNLYEPIIKNNDGSIELYHVQGKSVILTPFFSRYMMTEKRIKDLSEIIKSETISSAK